MENIIYAGYTITYDEPSNKWLGKLDAHVVSKCDSLKGLKAALDRRDDNVKKFKRFPAYITDYDDKLHPVTVTSIFKDSSYWEAWVTMDDSKDRRKVTLRYLYKQTPDNMARYDQIRQCNATIRQLKVNIQTIQDQMERVDEPTEQAEDNG